jgi:hypothetical protein
MMNDSKLKPIKQLHQILVHLNDTKREFYLKNKNKEKEEHTRNISS